jgi:antirestriction protein
LAADNLFRGAVISALHSKYENNYIMEQLFDYKMVDNRSVVEQAHEIQALAKELE